MKKRAPDKPCGTCEKVRKVLPRFVADKLRDLEKRGALKPKAETK
jgi:hypothetical protein